MTKYAPYTATPALSRARGWIGKTITPGTCQKWTNELYLSGAVGDWDGDHDADAVDGWKKAQAKGQVHAGGSPRDVPAGLPLYFSGGSHGYGHACISAGSGNAISTDAPTYGRVGQVDAGWFASHWGLTYLGYLIIEGNGYTLTDPAGTGGGAGGAGGTGSAGTNNIAPPQEDDELPSVKEVWYSDLIGVPSYVDEKKNPDWAPQTFLREIAEQVREVRTRVDHVWQQDVIPAPASASDIKTNPNWQPSSYLNSTWNHVHALEVKVAEVDGKIDALDEKIDSLGATLDALIDALSESDDEPTGTVLIDGA